MEIKLRRKQGVQGADGPSAAGPGRPGPDALLPKLPDHAQAQVAQGLPQLRPGVQPGRQGQVRAGRGRLLRQRPRQRRQQPGDGECGRQERGAPPLRQVLRRQQCVMAIPSVYNLADRISSKAFRRSSYFEFYR